MSIFISPSGAKFYIKNRNDIIFDVLQKQGYFEPQLLDAAFSHFSKNPGTIIDVGANIGTFCVELANRLPSCQFHAFEPVELALFELEENIAINGLTNIQVHSIGLSDFCGKVLGEVANPGGSFGHISLSEEADIMRRGEPPQFPRKLYDVGTLDRFNIENVSVIKVDAEGMEYKVFCGAKNTIRRYSPMLIFEAWQEPWFAEERIKLLDYIKNLGYSKLNIIGDNIIAIK